MVWCFKLLLFSDKLWSSKLLSSLFAAGLRLLFFRLFGAGRIRPECLQRIGCATSSSVVCPYLTCSGRSKMIEKNNVKIQKKVQSPRQSRSKIRAKRSNKRQVKFGASMFFPVRVEQAYRAWHACMCCSRSSFIPAKDLQAGRVWQQIRSRKDSTGSPRTHAKNERPKPKLNHVYMYIHTCP